jgi:predicted glycosyltransferase
MDRLRRIEDSNPRLTVVEFVREPMRLLQRAERIVSMGGYNTTCEALSLGKRSLIVPRVRPRVEQWIRAKSFQRLGLVDVLHPDDVTPEALSRWLASDGRSETDAPAKIDLNGLSRIPELVQEALDAPDATTGRARKTERGARSLAY